MRTTTTAELLESPPANGLASRDSVGVKLFICIFIYAGLFLNHPDGLNFYAMKHKFILAIILLYGTLQVSYSQSWQWINTGGGNSQDYGRTVSIAPDGTVFCHGVTQSNVNRFGPVTLNSIGAWNTFVCTYTNSGSLINATATSGNGSGSQIVSSGIKNIECQSFFITSFVGGGAYFDTVYLSVMQNVCAKYNDHARCLWVKPIDYRIQWSGMGMYGGHVYVQGTFNGVGAMIDTFALDTAKGNSFIARLDTNGNCLWVKQIKGLNYFTLLGIKNERFYCRSGGGGGTFNYDSLSVTLPNTLSYACITQIDTGGHLKSYHFIQGALATVSVTADAKRNYYTAGFFIHPSTIAGDSLYLYNNATQDGVLAKFDSTGALQWVKQFYSNNSVTVTSSATDDSGNTYITGYFKGKIVLGSDTISSQGSNYNMYVIRYNSDGVYMGIKVVPNAAGESLALDAQGDVIVTGRVFQGAVFDNLTFPGYGDIDFFVAKLSAINGISTGTEDEPLVIYPNPNQKRFTIQVPQSIVQSNTAQLAIYDNLGSTVQHGTIDVSSGKVQVDIGNVQKGIYHIKLASGNKKFTGKVVVE